MQVIKEIHLQNNNLPAKYLNHLCDLINTIGEFQKNLNNLSLNFHNITLFFLT